MQTFCDLIEKERDKKDSRNTISKVVALEDRKCLAKAFYLFQDYLS